MNILIFLLLSLQLPSWAQTESLRGAWQLKDAGDPGEVAVLIASDRYLSIAVYNEISNSFVRTYGGAYKTAPGKCILNIEFDTKDTSHIGEEITFQVSINETSLTLENLVKTTWTKIDDAPAVSALAGCWRITARIGSDGTMSAMPMGSRKTLKILSATRFQWIAINSVTKQFFGTGGGTYTLIDGKYTEHLAFFSRDPTRVGSQLSFEASVQNSKWFHTGKSSTGNAVNEVWEKQ